MCIAFTITVEIDRKSEGKSGQQEYSFWERSQTCKGWHRNEWRWIGSGALSGNKKLQPCERPNQKARSTPVWLGKQGEIIWHHQAVVAELSYSLHSAPSISALPVWLASRAKKKVFPILCLVVLHCLTREERNNCIRSGWRSLLPSILSSIVRASGLS